MRALLQRWAFTWKLACSCLYVQLCAYQEMRVPTTAVYLPDDATQDELAGLAAEQREIAGR